MRLRYSQHALLKKPPLIRNPGRQSGFQRYGFWFLTVLFWFAFLLLFRIALTPLAWWLGAEAVYEMFAVKVNSEDFYLLLSLYLTIVLLIGLLLIGWARYNQLRFRGRERRNRFLSPVATAELAESFAVSEALVRTSQRHRRLTLKHVDGRLLDCRSTGPLDRLADEPIPLARGRFLLQGLEIRRGEDWRWSVYRGEERLFHGTDFASCQAFIRAGKASLGQ